MKWRYEIYINGEFENEYRLTVAEIEKVDNYINKIIKERGDKYEKR